MRVDELADIVENLRALDADIADVEVKRPREGCRSRCGRRWLRSRTPAAV